MVRAGTMLIAGFVSLLLGAAGGSLVRTQPVTAGENAAAASRPDQAPPKVLDAVMATAERAMLDTKPAQAAAVLEAAVKDWPRDQVLWLALARTRTRLPDGAAPAYEAYRTALQLGDATAEDEFQAGTAASRAGLPEQAVEHYRSAEAADPTDPRFPLYAAQVLTRLGRTDEARASLFRATQLDEHLSIAWGSLAEIALKENRPGVALQYIAHAREQEPRVTAWRVIEARARNRQNQPGEALAVLEGVDEADRLSLPVVRLYATSAAMLGRTEDAAARFAQAAGVRMTDADVVLEAADWLERAGDRAGALRLARHAAMLGHERAPQVVQRLEAGG